MEQKWSKAIKNLWWKAIKNLSQNCYSDQNIVEDLHAAFFILIWWCACCFLHSHLSFIGDGEPKLHIHCFLSIKVVSISSSSLISYPSSPIKPYLASLFNKRFPAAPHKRFATYGILMEYFEGGFALLP